MDALAHGGYSSSSSSSSIDDEDKTKTDTTTKGNETQATSALLLASYYSDDDDNDNDDDESDKGSKLDDNDHSRSSKKRKNNSIDSSHLLSPLSPPSSKKQELDLLLPKPRLYNPQTDNAFDSLVLFSKDYLSPLQEKQLKLYQEQQNQQQQQPHQQQQDNMNKSLLATKLNNLYHQFYNTSNNDNNHTNNSNTSSMYKPSSSFASHLKNQKEFGNPHLFPSIITHFGIDPLGSNCVGNLYSSKRYEQKCDDGIGKNSKHSESKGDNDNKVCSCQKDDKMPFASMSSIFAKFEYVEKLVQKEEENRIRNAL